MSIPVDQLSDEALRREWCERLGYVAAGRQRWRVPDDDKYVVMLPDPLTDANTAIQGCQQATARAKERNICRPAFWLDVGSHQAVVDSFDELLSGDVCRRLTVATVEALRRMENVE